MRPVRAGAARGGAGSGHVVLPHPADVMLRAWAPTRLGCVAEAVRALTDSYARVGPSAAGCPHAFTVTGRSPEATLVAVLEEAVFLLDARGQVAVAARLTDAGDGLVRGVLDVVPAGDVEVVGSAPKGVSWSGLSFSHTGGTWRCTVIVDV